MHLTWKLKNTWAFAMGGILSFFSIHFTSSFQIVLLVEFSKSRIFFLSKSPLPEWSLPTHYRDKRPGFLIFKWNSAAPHRESRSTGDVFKWRCSEEKQFHSFFKAGIFHEGYGQRYHIYLNQCHNWFFPEDAQSSCNKASHVSSAFEDCNDPKFNHSSMSKPSLFYHNHLCPRQVDDQDGIRMVFAF